MEIQCGHPLLGQLVSYTYTGNISRAFDVSPGAMIIPDMISYRLYDSFGAFSTLGVVSLAITSRLKAVTAQSRNDSSWICVEDVESRIHLYAQDTAESRRNVTIVFTVVPNRGSLRRIDSNRTLAPGDTLGTNCTEPPTCLASVRYLPSRDYFNSPPSKGNGDGVSKGSGGFEFFSFYVVASDNREYSNEVVQEIQVTNSNDPSDIQCPTQPHEVQALGTSIYSGTSNFSPLDRIVIRGFAIDDPDNGAGIVKVKVSANFGLLSLNMKSIDLLDFNSATYCYEGGGSHCFGSGTSDRHLVFFAEPGHAQMALDGMVYQSVASNVRDDITVTIFDGAGGDCLGETKFQPGLTRQECWQVSCQLHVIVGGHADPRESVLTTCTSTQVWVGVIIGVCVLISLSCGRYHHKQHGFINT